MAETVMLTEAAAKELVSEVAVNVTARSLAGGLLGAVYVVGEPLGVTVGDTVPQGEVEQERVQVTPLLLASLARVAVNGAVAPASRVAESGAMVTATDGTVMVAEAFFVGSAAEVEVMVTVRLVAGGTAGAVYVVEEPLGVGVGETEPQEEEEQDTVQLTALLASSLLTVPVNCAVPFTWTVPEVGATETVMAGTLITRGADLVVSAADVAVRVTVKSLGGGLGGV
jgi:hypothetical protein